MEYTHRAWNSPAFSGYGRQMFLTRVATNNLDFTESLAKNFNSDLCVGHALEIGHKFVFDRVPKELERFNNENEEVVNPCLGWQLWFVHLHRYRST